MLRSDLQVSLFLPMSVMYLMGSGDCPTLVRKFASLIFSCPRHLARPHTLSAVSIVSYMGHDCITCYFHDVIGGRIVVYFYSRSVSGLLIGQNIKRRCWTSHNLQNNGTARHQRDSDMRGSQRERGLMRCDIKGWRRVGSRFSDLSLELNFTCLVLLFSFSQLWNKIP